MDNYVENRQNRRWQLHCTIVLLFFCWLLLLLSACSDDAAPPPTAVPTELPRLPTMPPTPTALPLPTIAALVSPLSPLRTQAAITGSAALSSSVVVSQNGALQASDNISIVNSVSTTTVDSASQAVASPSETTVVTETGALAAEDAMPCVIETDVALLSYPDIGTHLGCAVAAASFDAVAMNEFGPGPDYTRFMLWLSSENQIYVLHPKKSWTVYEDTWTEEQETFTCNPLGGEATSPPLPRRGFGKIWCTVDGLQDVMGTVEREERLCQHTVTQRFVRGRLVACYEDATIRFFRIMDDKSWDQMLIQ